MSGDAHVQFWESLGVRFPGATLPGADHLRHTKFIRLRDDKDPRTVASET